MFNLLEGNPILFLVQIVSLVVAITIHEFAHARTAVYFGDPTPELEGRVTLNPASHLDPLGSIMLLFLGFGWGKPVRFDPYNLKNPQRESAIIAAAGPLTNLAFAALCAGAYHLTNSVWLIPFISINVFLCVLNLLPLHPFDGFKVVGGLLPEDKAIEWYQLERYWMFFLIALMIPIQGKSMMSQITGSIGGIIINLLIPGFTT